jgi:hypothetical protein
MLPRFRRLRIGGVGYELGDQLRDRRLGLAYLGGQLGHTPRRHLRQRRLGLEQLAQHRDAVRGLLDEPQGDLLGFRPFAARR